MSTSTTVTTQRAVMHGSGRWGRLCVGIVGHRVIAVGSGYPIVPRSGRCRSAAHTWRCPMARFVGLDVSQKLTSICVVDDAGRRLWRGQCHSDPEPIERAVRRHAGDDASIGIETGPMTPWLVHE